MAYFKIGSTDLSAYVSGLKVNSNAQYNAATNAAGNTVVDYINSKREIEVTFIPLKSTQLSTITNVLSFSVSISFMNPDTNDLATNVACILPKKNIEFYTIQTGNTQYKAFTLTFEEL